MKNTTTVDKQLRKLRAEKIMQSAQRGGMRRGERVPAWQDYAQLERQFHEVQDIKNSEQWGSWGTVENGGWSYEHADESGCKLKVVVFKGGTATCWEVFDRGTDVVVGRTVCNEKLASATVWGLEASYWPTLHGPTTLPVGVHAKA